MEIKLGKKVWANCLNSNTTRRCVCVSVVLKLSNWRNVKQSNCHMINNTFTSLFKRCLRVILCFFALDNIEYIDIQRTIALMVVLDPSERFVLVASSGGTAQWQRSFLFTLYVSLVTLSITIIKLVAWVFFWCVNDTKLNGMYLRKILCMHAKMNAWFARTSMIA